MCGRWLESTDDINAHVTPRKHFFNISHSEPDASEWIKDSQRKKGGQEKGGGQEEDSIEFLASKGLNNSPSRVIENYTVWFKESEAFTSDLRHLLTVVYLAVVN